MSSKMFRVSLAGESFEVAEEKVFEKADELVAKHGGIPSIVPIATAATSGITITPSISRTYGGKMMVNAMVSLPAPELQFSDWTKQVKDQSATDRITELHKKLADAGVKIDSSQQLYATGTRMAVVGYETQTGRKQEHDAKKLLIDAAHELSETVTLESREDIGMSAKEFADNLSINGSNIFLRNGSKQLLLSEQAIIGLLSRIDSPCKSYFFGLEKRIQATFETMAMTFGEREISMIQKGIDMDRMKMLETLMYECNRNSDTELKLRTRVNPNDVFAIMSPGYSTADAPEVLKQIIDDMPDGARASWAYDPNTTAWEMRADVWTPTPVQEQAVGEPFEGYVAFSSRDNGTGRFNGGGGISLIRCLNASTYVASGNDVSRVHRGKIMYDIKKMMSGAIKAANILVDAWGKNKSVKVDMPELVSINDAIPGFWRALLKSDKDLAGVLPGGARKNVDGLTRAFVDQRRNPDEIVRSDFAQGWTKYIQDQESNVRRQAEVAIGDWLVSNRKMGYVAAKDAE